MAAASLLFVLLWAGVRANTILVAVDVDVTTWITQTRPPWLVATAVAVSDVGSPGVMIGVAGLVALAVARRARSARPVGVAAAGVGTLTAGDVGLKFMIARLRPPHSLWAMATSGYSFPSGHAVFSAGVALLVYLMLRDTVADTRRALVQWGALAAGGLVVAVGASRVIVGVHYLSDVIAGWSVAVIAVGLVLIVAGFARHRPPLAVVEPETGPSTGSADAMASTSRS